jgi:hypothetical protein
MTTGKLRNLPIQSSILWTAVLALFLLAGLSGCGGSKATTIPTALIKDYMAKHQTMVDPALATLYIKEEQADVLDAINRTIAEKESQGSLEDLRHATFDFANMKVELLGEKEIYVDDAPAAFLKVATKGSFMMKLNQESKSIPADGILILEKVSSDWKITETVNPWS